MIQSNLNAQPASERFDDDRAIADALSKARTVALTRRRITDAVVSEIQEKKKAGAGAPGMDDMDY